MTDKNSARGHCRPVIRNETFRQLFQALSKLFELRRYRVCLYYFRGLRFKAIADLENVTGNFQ